MVDLEGMRTTFCKAMGHLLDELEREGDVRGVHAVVKIELARRMADALHLSDADRETLVNAARLSHILKVGLPNEIAIARGGLNEMHLEVVCDSLRSNVAYLRDTGVLAEEADALASIHEWWDGSGMPKGLERKEIPLVSRILSLICAYVTLREGSSYTSLHDREEAWIEIESDADSHFDPYLLEPFRQVLAAYYAQNHDQAQGRLLVVEDDTHTAGIFSRRLGWAGYDVTACSTVAEGRSALEKDGWRAVLLDIMMPEGDGLSFCSEIRSGGLCADIPIIICSCRSDQAAIEMAREAGASAYAVKPVSMEALLKYLAEPQSHDAMLVFEK